MKKYIYLGIAALALTSCNDFLDREPMDFGGSDSYYKTENDLKLAVNAFYEYLPLNGTGSSNTGLYADDTNSDNQCKPNASAILFYKGNYKVPDINVNAGTIVNTNWDFAHFRGINFFFQKIAENEGTIMGSQTMINHYIGEAYFFRAWEHFRLLRFYGDAPIMDKFLTDNTAELVAASKRYPRNEVARFILKDLDKAIELLQSTAPEVGRVTKAAAYALKSRVALHEGTWEKYHAGTAFVPGTDKWPGKEYWPDFKWPEETGSAEAEWKFFLKEAIDASEKAVEGHPLNDGSGNIVTDYMSLFNSTNLSGIPEVILARYYMTGVSMHSCSYFLKAGGGNGITRQAVATYLMANGKPIYASGSGYKGDNTSFDEFTDRDPRLAGYRVDGTYPENPDYTGTPAASQYLTFGVARPAGSKNGFSYTPAIQKTGQEKATTGYEVNKWVSFNSDQLDQNGCTTAVPIFRSAECMLNYMEAYYELYGMGGKIDEYWRLIRKRAGVNQDYTTTIEATDMSKEALTDFGAYSKGSLIDAKLYNIRRERRCELIAEGRRLDDLKRWKSLDSMKDWQPEGFKLSSDIKSLYKENELSSGVATDPDTDYLRPLQAFTTSQAYNGYTFPIPHYLDPIPGSEFIITVDPNTGKSVLYQNPGWPTSSGSQCQEDYTGI